MLQTHRIVDPEAIEALSMHSVALSEELSLAVVAGRLGGVGPDLVHRAINHALSVGARPMALSAMYLGGRMAPELVKTIESGIADSCRLHHLRLADFATAKSAGGAYLVGSALGRVIREPSPLVAGDKLVGIPGTGLHSAGFAFARAVLFGRLGLSLNQEIPGVGETVASALLSVRRCYLAEVVPLLEGGFIRRAIPVGSGGVVGAVRSQASGLRPELLDSWPTPTLFEVILEASGRSRAELLAELSMGVGMLLVVPPEAISAVKDAAPDAFDLGVLA